MPSKLIFFSKQRFNIFPSFLWSPYSLKVEQKIPGDMSAHEAEGLIKPIQKFVLLNMLLGLSFSAHSHPIQANIVQGYPHICTPIWIVERCKDTGYNNWGIHLFVCWNNQFLKKLRRYLQITLQKPNQFAIMLVSSLSTSTCTLSQSQSHLDRLLWT